MGQDSYLHLCLYYWYDKEVTGCIGVVYELGVVYNHIDPLGKCRAVP